MTDMEILGAAMSYTDKTVEGAGGLKGANCTIQSIVDITGGHRVTFAWKDNNDDTQTSTMDVMDGEKGSTGETGPAGVGIASIEKTGTSGLVDTYTITYTNGNTDTFTVTNGSDATVTVDSELSDESENPVQNKVIKGVVDDLEEWTTAEAKSVSGNPITLTDGSARNAEGLSVECNPKQNLHGYDHPWAGGAGKNKIPMTVANIKALNVVGTWSGNTYTVRGVSFELLTDEAGNITGIKATGTATGGVATITLVVTPDLDSETSYILNGCPSNGGANTYNVQYSNMRTYAYDDFGDGVTVQKFDYSTYPEAQIVIRIISGYAIPSGGIIFYPMLRLASVSDATFEPYTNECPITGRTECVVDRVGRNLVDISAILDGKTLSTEDGSVQTGTETSYVTDYIPVSKNQTIYIPATGTTRRWFYDTSKTAKVYLNNKGAQVYTPTEDGFIRVTANKTTVGINDFQIEYGNTSTAYVPYSHDTATITFGQTVYGGSVDFKTGKVTVTHGLFDMGNEWAYDSASWPNPVFYAFLPDAKTFASSTRLICDTYSQSERNATNNWGTVALMHDKELQIKSLSTQIYVMDTNYNDATAFATAMSGHYICYELATPIELTLTPAELELLKGYNYITSNGTTIALDYLPDSLLAEAENYVDVKIPPAPSSDGTYVLTCTVTSGTPAYSWESAT